MKKIDELFCFEESDNGYRIKLFNYRDDPSVTEVDIPAEYNGLPVREIGDAAFFMSKFLTRVNIPEGIEKIGNSAFCSCGLREVTLPESLKELDTEAFLWCSELERVIFRNKDTEFGFGVFEGCLKIAAENIMQGLARSCDITKPFATEKFYWSHEVAVDLIWADSALRDDVFELALKYDGFALFDKENVFVEIVERNLCRFLPLCENAGWSIGKKFLGELLDISLDNGFTEITAWLLDYKNRKFGFGKV